MTCAIFDSILSYMHVCVQGLLLASQVEQVCSQEEWWNEAWAHPHLHYHFLHPRGMLQLDKHTHINIYHVHVWL